MVRDLWAGMGWWWQLTLSEVWWEFTLATGNDGGLTPTIKFMTSSRVRTSNGGNSSHLQGTFLMKGPRVPSEHMFTGMTALCDAAISTESSTTHKVTAVWYPPRTRMITVTRALVLKQHNLFAQFDWHTRIINNVLLKVLNELLMIMKSCLAFFIWLLIEHYLWMSC